MPNGIGQFTYVHWGYHIKGLFCHQEAALWVMDKENDLKRISCLDPQRVNRVGRKPGMVRYLSMTKYLYCIF